MQDLFVTPITKDHVLPVGLEGETVTITNLSGDVVYYGDRQVSSVRNTGTLGVGSSVAITAPKNWIVSGSLSTVSLAGVSNGIPDANLPSTIARTAQIATTLRGDLPPYSIAANSTADQTSQVNQLFADAISLGKDPQLPAGTLNVTNVVCDYSGITPPFLGYPAAKIVSTGNGFTTLKQIAGSTGDLLRVVGRTGTGTGHTGKVIGFTLQNIRLIGNASLSNPTGTATTGDALLSMSVFQWAVLDNCYFLGAQGDGIVFERQNFTLPTQDDYSFHLGMRSCKIFQIAGRGITTRDQGDHTLQAPNSIGEVTMIDTEVQHCGMDGIKGPFVSLTMLGGQVNSAGVNSGHAVHFLAPPNHSSLTFSNLIYNLHLEANCKPGVSAVRIDGGAHTHLNLSLLCDQGEDGVRIGDLQCQLAANYTPGDSTVTVAASATDPGSGPATEGWVDADHFVTPNGSIYSYTGRTKTTFTGVAFISGTDVALTAGAILIPDVNTRAHRIDKPVITGSMQGRASTQTQKAVLIGPMSQYLKISNLHLWPTTFYSIVHGSDANAQSDINVIDDRGFQTEYDRGATWAINPRHYESLTPATEYILETKTPKDPYLRWHLRADGYQSVGPGTSAPDVALSRPGTSKWLIDATAGAFMTGPVYPDSAVQDGTTPAIYQGAGSPNGSVAARIGSWYLRSDAASTSQAVYQKVTGTGNTGWLAVPGRSREDILTANQGLIAQTAPRNAQSGTFATTNGALFGGLVTVRAEEVISNICIQVTAAGATPANLSSVYAALYAPTGNRVAVSNNQVATGRSVGPQQIPLLGAYTIPDNGEGVYYAAALMFGTAGGFPTLLSGQSLAGGTYARFGSVGSPSGISQTGLTDQATGAATMPNLGGGGSPPASSFAASSVEVWLGVS